MAKKTNRILPLDEAFRRFLRARATRAGLADEIDNYGWVHQRQSSADYRDDEEYGAAIWALDRLKRGVKEQDIGLRGVLGNLAVQEIDPSDSTVGELHAFENTLEVSTRGITVRRYTAVHCLESDVSAVVRRIKKAAIGVRHAGINPDGIDALIKEYLAMASRPSMAGVAEFFKGKGIVGHRQEIRDDYHRLRGGHVSRGRPLK